MIIGRKRLTDMERDQHKTVEQQREQLLIDKLCPILLLTPLGQMVADYLRQVSFQEAQSIEDANVQSEETKELTSLKWTLQRRPQLHQFRRLWPRSFFQMDAILDRLYINVFEQPVCEVIIDDLATIRKWNQLQNEFEQLLLPSLASQFPGMAKNQPPLRPVCKHPKRLGQPNLDLLHVSFLWRDNDPPIVIERTRLASRDERDSALIKEKPDDDDGRKWNLLVANVPVTLVFSFAFAFYSNNTNDNVVIRTRLQFIIV